MSPGVVGGLIAIGAVILVGMLMRAGQGSREPSPAAPADDALSEGAMPDPADDDLPADEDDDEVVAVTSDGFAIVPDTHAVRLVPPDEEGESWKTGESARTRRGELALAASWHAADFTGARIVRGAADEGPWRFEALGRDGEYTAFVFETREGADAALTAFTTRGVIRLGHDEDGQPMPPSPEQFAEARRVYLETEAALESTEEDDE